METLITMSTKELSRIEVIQKAFEKRLTQAEAAKLMGISVRQTKRLVAAYRTDGPSGLVSKRRGRTGNHKTNNVLKEYAVDLIRQHYADFRPTFAAEKLAESHNLRFSSETIRKWMIEAGLWITRAEKRKRAYQPRYRRDCLGELIQIDGSHHAWFEDRAPKCTLLVYIDDATSEIMHLLFTKAESTFSYFDATKAYLGKHGKPVAFYSDKHSTFRTNKKGELGGDGITQYGRALHDLNVDIIFANSCQAKGRVERANQTLQDRLVKEMRLRGISNIDDANHYCNEFIEDYNRRFAKPPKSTHNAHRPLLNTDNLDEIFCWQEDRNLSNNLTVQYNKILYLIEDNTLTRSLRRSRVTIYDYPDGNIEVRHQGEPLPYSVFDKLQRIDQGTVASRKRLSNVLGFIKEKQVNRDEQRSASCPSRRHVNGPGVNELKKATVVNRKRSTG